MGSAVGYAVWAFAAGALIPVMAILNGGLGRALGGPQWAAVVLFGVGLIASLAAAIATRAPAPASLAGIGPLQLCGGLIVAFYVLSITFLAPRFGVGNAILFVVAAQIATAAAIDHFGLFGATVRPVSPMRLAGLVLMTAGLGLTQWPQVLKR